jgi:hypothetical protein
VIFGVQNDPHTNLSLRDHSIRGEKLAWCVGVYSPYVVYPNCDMCDSELFSHVFKTHKSNPIIHVYDLANLFNCQHSKHRRFEFVCQYFESPNSFNVAHPPKPFISPLVCMKIDFTMKIVVSNLSTREMPHAVTGNAYLPPTACATSCYGAETLGNNIYVRRETLRLLLVSCTGPFWHTQQL